MSSKYEGLPRVSYTEPKRRLAIRRLRERALGDRSETDRSILQACALNPNVPLLDYLRVWSVSMGEDVMHLAGGEAKAVPVRAPPPEPVPRGPGRPPGSKNRERETTSV